MKKFLMITAAALASIFILAACAPSPGGGYAGPDKKTTGGNASQSSNINLKSIEITEEGSETIVAISMVSGSRVAGAEETKLDSLPSYEVSCLPLPDRLLIRFKGIDHYDYADSGEASGGAVISTFKMIPEKSDMDFYLYFQLSSQCDYSVSEETDRLIIRLKPTGERKTASFAILDAFYKLQDGTISESGFTPTLCSDGRGVCLISQPFDSEAAAAEAGGALAAKYATELNGRQASTVTLSTGELPSLALTQAPETVSAPSILKNGEEIVLPQAVSNGKFLTESPDGRVLFARIYEIDEQSDAMGASTPIVTKVYLASSDGSVEETHLPEFTDIDSAQYSPSGRFIAVLDIDSENRILYVFDTQTGDLVNLGEEGLGNITNDFTWDGAEDVIYSISGNDTTLQLMKADMRPGAADKISAVEERPITQGRIAMAGGNLYISDIDEAGAEAVYRYNFHTGERENVGSALVFEVSPDERYLAQMSLSASASEEDGEVVDLKVIDLATLKQTDVLSRASVTGFKFDGASKLIIANGGGGTDERYKTLIQIYDPATNQLKDDCETLAEVFEVSQSKSAIYLPVFVADQNTNYYVTYLYEPGLY